MLQNKVIFLDFLQITGSTVVVSPFLVSHSDTKVNSYKPWQKRSFCLKENAKTAIERKIDANWKIAGCLFILYPMIRDQ